MRRPASRSTLVPLLLLASIAVALATPARGAETRAFVYATDFSGPSGTIADIHFGPPRTVASNLAIVSSDAVLRSFGSLLYVVNRSGFDNIQILDPANMFTTVRQFSVGNGSNPHDIQVVSANKAFVTRYDSADLWVVNPQSGAHTATISLAAFADADGIPEMDHLALRNGKIFVSVERLDRNNFYAPAGGSRIVVIDAATNALVDTDLSTPGIQGILLPFQNPATELVVDPAGMVLVGCAGSYGALDGGVARIDPTTYAVSSEITESALGGDINDVAVLSTQRGFASISDASFNTLVRSYDRGTGAVTGTPYSTSGFNIGDIEVSDRAELWLCDRTPSNPGVRIFDAMTGSQLTTTPLGTGLPPQDLQFDGGPNTVGVGDHALGPVAALRIIGVSPNPMFRNVVIRCRLGDVAGSSPRAELRIFDATGRRVRRLERPGLTQGEFTLDWNGLDDRGVAVRAGVYFLRLQVGASVASAQVLRLR